jgi:GTPase SAR1 family protein
MYACLESMSQKLKEFKTLQIVYDITRHDTFAHVSMWLAQFRELTHDHVPVILVGNKTDLRHVRDVTTAEGEALAGWLITLFLYSLHVLWCMCSFCIALPLNYCSQLWPCKHHFHIYLYRISHHTQPSAQHGMLFAETSCESGANVAAAFETLLQGTFPARHVTSSRSYCMT